MAERTCDCASSHCHSIGLAFALMLALPLLSSLSACNPRQPTPVIAPPTVVITSPTSGHMVQSGVDVPINCTANDAQGVVKVELWVDGLLYRVDASPEPVGQRTFVVSQPWHAAAPQRMRSSLNSFALSM